MVLSRKSLLGRLGLASLVMAGATFVAVSVAEARGGRGFSFGSRGAKTFSAPPKTNTAPNAAKPIERSMTNPGAATSAAGRGVAGAAQAARPSMFRNLLMGGLIGAGLMALFGMGGGMAAMLGFLLQALLIGGVIWFIVSFFRSRKAGAGGMPGAGASATTAGTIPGLSPRQTSDGVGSQAGSYGYGGGPAATAGVAGTIEVGQTDFDTFERLLGEIQSSYSKEDLQALGDRMTPEMLSYFAHELAENKRNGLVNDLSGVKLLQGDLAEAWSEPDGEYATVAMRYEIVDAMVERSTGRVVEGDRSRPEEVTEIWTFRRNPGTDARSWELSAIQQTT